MKLEYHELTPSEQEEFKDRVAVYMKKCLLEQEDAEEAAFIMILRRRGGIED